ncbi:MAG: ABC transporter permease [Lachnospiraceae bacterium]|nr:ABC transporter permease [Lachnospiraceae bacterium]
MSIKKKVAAAILVIAVLLLNVGIFFHSGATVADVQLTFQVATDHKTDISIFYASNTNFDLEHCKTQSVNAKGDMTEMTFSVPSDTTAIRFDLGDGAKTVSVADMYFHYRNSDEKVDLQQFAASDALAQHSIETSMKDGVLQIDAVGDDPYAAITDGPDELQPEVVSHLATNNMIKNIIFLIIFDLGCLVFFCFRKKISGLPIELIQNRHLIMNLAKNDFKTKYAGSYLGITWAFVQPIITVLVYWFVFQVGLRSGNMNNFPFVLWLVAGLVPWFFFQDTLNGGTNALIEYSYLVKKVVFKISILPIVKAISALFVHLFFIVFTIILYSCYGYFPDLYVLQVLYYTFALFVFTLGICYATCAIVIFFRDLTQIINIVLQVGVWMTPIMWNIDIMGADFPGWLTAIFKANPLFYIVNGYRDALINKVWFWSRFDLTFYFWLITAVVFLIGTVIFKRLKVHFADIL